MLPLLTMNPRMVETSVPSVLLTLEANVCFLARLLLPWWLHPSATVAHP